jgi:hypothetical protein
LVIAGEQVGVCRKNPSFAIQQAAELYNHQEDIKLMIVKNAIGYVLPIDTVMKAVY